MRLPNLFSAMFSKRTANHELDEELLSHMDHRADDLEREGVSRGEAERRARVEFGGYVRFKEESHRAAGGRFFEILMQDVRFALRVLGKSPGFAMTAIVTLALAIGANAVVFGVMDAFVLRSLNVPDTKTLWGTAYGDGSGFQSYENYVDLRDRNHSFESLAAFSFDFAGLETNNQTEGTTAFATTGNYFDVLRVQPYLGRFFHGADEHGPGSAPYIVLSYAYWHNRFQDDHGVVGRVVQLNKHPFTILGVAPPSFRGTLMFISPDFFMPIVNKDQVDGTSSLHVRADESTVFEAFGHLKPGVTVEQATRDVNAIGAALEKAYPKDVSHKESKLIHPGLTAFGGPAKAFLAGLMLLALLILLAACANLGSLFAARTADRGREIALRLALGSNRGRILRQLLTEAMLISLAGGALGLAGGIVLLRKLATWQPFPGAPIHLPVNPDGTIYVVALVLALVCSLLFGMLPMRQVLRTDAYAILRGEGSATAMGRRITLRDVLLVVQIGICAVLVTSSLVALRGLLRSIHGDFGMEPHHAMTVNTNLAMAGYSDDRVPVMQRRMIEAMQSIPGVEHAGLVAAYPPLVYTAGDTENVFRNETTDLRQANAVAAPYRYVVSPGYLDAAGTRMLAGRDLTWHDDKQSLSVALVNREFAEKMFGSVSGAIGRFFKLHTGIRVQVVGVVENGKYVSLTEDQQAAIFLPFLQWPVSTSYLIIRSQREAQPLIADIKNGLKQLDAGLPTDVASWSSLMDVVLFPARVATAALGVMGAMGALLAITGIFGLATYSVSRRRRELGIRVALGAQRREILAAALGRSLLLLVWGSVAGLILGLLATRVLASIVYDATPRDPLVLAGAVLVMLLLGLIATWIPAQRALRVNPLVLLREE